jgi:hypothetical protein
VRSQEPNTTRRSKKESENKTWKPQLEKSLRGSHLGLLGGRRCNFLPILKGKGAKSVAVATRRGSARDEISEALPKATRRDGLEPVSVGDAHDGHSATRRWAILNGLQRCTWRRLLGARARLVAGFAAGEARSVTLLDLGLAALAGCMALAPAVDTAHVRSAPWRDLAATGRQARLLGSSLATATRSSLEAAGCPTPSRGEPTSTHESEDLDLLGDVLGVIEPLT